MFGPMPRVCAIGRRMAPCAYCCPYCVVKNDGFCASCFNACDVFPLHIHNPYRPHVMSNKIDAFLQECLGSLSSPSSSRKERYHQCFLLETCDPFSLNILLGCLHGKIWGSGASSLSACRSSSASSPSFHISQTLN